MRRGTARHERSNLSKKSSDLLPEAEEAARIDQRIAGASLGGGTHWRFTELAAEFARLKVDLIVAATTPAVIAAKHGELHAWSC